MKVRDSFHGRSSSANQIARKTLSSPRRTWWFQNRNTRTPCRASNSERVRSRIWPAR